MVFVLSGVSAPAQGEPVVNAVTAWNLIAVNTLVLIPASCGRSTARSPDQHGDDAGRRLRRGQRDRARSIIGHISSTRRFSSKASKEAAVATAAYRVLSNIVSTVPASIHFPNRAGLLQSLATQYDASLAAIPDSPFKTQGIAAGNAAAAAMIAAREDDGRFGPSQWVPNPIPGTGSRC